MYIYIYTYVTGTNMCIYNHMYRIIQWYRYRIDLQIDTKD